MNQKVIGTVFLENMEVGQAYNEGFKMILENEQLKDFKFVLTIEEDNYPQNPDALLKLYESIDNFDAIGGLYFTKGEAGQPMCYGDPNAKPLNFIPQIPKTNEPTECNGLGMGFTLFRLEMFKDKRFEYGKWFSTTQEFIPNVGARVYTQDLYFFEKAKGLGYRFACDGRVPVVHWEQETKTAW
jgi:glycosyltransferase involved in cell wall biosynthesis